MNSLAKQKVRDPQNLSSASVENLPFDNNTFDIVTSRFTLHYIKDLSKVYGELSRILKPGGSLIYIVHHPFRDVGYQEEKKYGKQEIVSIVLYDGQVKIHFPTHTLVDYLSDAFFENFYVDYLTEEKSPEEYLDELGTPGFIGVHAIKRDELTA